MMSKKGMGGIDKLVGLVVLIFLISALAPSALTGLFNTTAFADVPTYVPTILGTLGLVGFIYIMIRGAGAGK